MIQTQNLSTLKFLSDIKLQNIDELSQIVYVCDFNFFFNSQSEADGGNPNFKSKSFEKNLKYEKL